MGNHKLELCKRVINGGVPVKNCQDIDCLDCPFKDEKIACDINSIEAYEIAQNYIKEHEKTVNTINSIEEQTITLDDLKEYKKEYDKYDVINKAEHYNQGIEVIDIIESYNLDFSTANIIKYVLRAKYKGNYLQDLLKAKYYLERLINNYERDTNKENR